MLNKDKIKTNTSGIDVDGFVVKAESKVEIDKTEEEIVKEENIIMLDSLGSKPLAMQNCAVCERPKIHIGDKVFICADCLAKIRKLIKGVKIDEYK